MTEAEAESRPTARISGRSLCRRLPHHQAGAGDDAVLVRLHDAGVDPWREAEVVGVDDQMAHAQKPRSASSLGSTTSDARAILPEAIIWTVMSYMHGWSL